MQEPSSFLDSRLSVLTVGVLGSLVFLVCALCALCIVRCFDRCGDEQRRALRDNDERLVGPWAMRMQQMRQLTLSPARGAGVAGSRRAAYARLPLTDRTSSSIFVGLPS